MKASKFSDAQRVFILKEGEGGTPERIAPIKPSDPQRVSEAGEKMHVASCCEAPL